jgi:glutaredoxin
MMTFREMIDRWLPGSRNKKRRRMLRLRLRRAPLDHLKFTVYTREACGCCDQALLILRDFQKRYGYELELIDLDTESPAELKKEYDTWVPVVAVNGKVRFKGKVNEILLHRLLEAEERAQRGR